MEGRDKESFDAYKNLILYRLNELSKGQERSAVEIKSLHSKVDHIGTAVTVLKTKAAVYGSIGGALVSAVFSHFFK